MMDTQIQIGLANRQEAVHIAEISRLYVEEGLGWSWRPQRIRDAMKNPDTAVVKASVDAMFAGFAVMRFGSQEAHLDLIAVKPRFRRNGVGTALLGWLEESVNTAGISIVRLELREKNKNAFAFYEKRGYKKVRRIEGYYSGIENGVELARDCCVSPVMDEIIRNTIDR